MKKKSLSSLHKPRSHTTKKAKKNHHNIYTPKIKSKITLAIRPTDARATLLKKEQLKTKLPIQH